MHLPFIITIYLYKLKILMFHKILNHTYIHKLEGIWVCMCTYMCICDCVCVCFCMVQCVCVCICVFWVCFVCVYMVKLQNFRHLFFLLLWIHTNKLISEHYNFLYILPYFCSLVQMYTRKHWKALIFYLVVTWVQKKCSWMVIPCGKW